MNNIIIWLMVAVGILVMVIIVLALVYFKMSTEEKKGKTKAITTEEEGGDKTKATGGYSRQSVFDFMEFDRVEDNMIIQKNDKRFLMVIECQGINYDLMSGVERNSVESGFMQFLNSLRHPIQIYTQTRTINLESSLGTYKKRLDEIKMELERKELRYKQMQSSGEYSKEELDKQSREIIKDRNLYEYGKDIVFYTEKMSLNKSVLRKQYYVVIPYYSAEAGNDLLDKEEIKNLAFSELYTKAQSVARVLSGCSIVSRVLDSYELVDLLYTAYNRDESESYGLDKALKAGYDELYSTAQDVLDKKMELLDRQIEEKASELAQKAVEEVRTEKQRSAYLKEKALDSFVKQMAQDIVKENAQYIGQDTADRAVSKIKNKKEVAKAEGGK